MNNRNDKEALEELKSKLKKNAITILGNTPVSEQESISRQVIKETE